MLPIDASEIIIVLKKSCILAQRVKSGEKMHIMTAATKTYELKEVEAYLKDFELEHTLKELSSICAYAYSKEYSKFLNLIQSLPAIFNSVAMFCNGVSKGFNITHFRELHVMVSSLDLQDKDSRGVMDEVYKVTIKALRHYENVRYVFGRLGFIFDWIEANKKELSFKKVTKIELQDFLITFFGAHSLGAAGGHLPIFNPMAFFKESSYKAEEIDALTKVIDENMSLTTEEFKIGTFENLEKKSKSFDETFTLFEEKPFLKIAAGYLLTSPHFGVNELISICAKFYILSYSEKFQSDASKYFGLGFEDYISSLFALTTSQNRFEREPFYKGTKNKGIDLVDIRRGKTPLLIEIHKAVVHKTVIYDFNIKDFEGFVKKVIIEKFEQMFKWLKSHEMIVNNVNLRENVSHMQMILCMSQEVPLLQFNEPNEILMKLLNESWEKIIGDVQPLKTKNIYILGSSEVEHLTAVSRGGNIRPSIILFNYKKYLSRTPEHCLKDNKKIEIRKNFTSWIMDEYDCKKHKNSFCLAEGSKVLEKCSSKFKK